MIFDAVTRPQGKIGTSRPSKSKLLGVAGKLQWNVQSWCLELDLSFPLARGLVSSDRLPSADNHPHRKCFGSLVVIRAGQSRLDLVPCGIGILKPQLRLHLHSLCSSISVCHHLYPHSCSIIPVPESTFLHFLVRPADRFTS